MKRPRPRRTARAKAPAGTKAGGASFTAALRRLRAAYAELAAARHGMAGLQRPETIPETDLLADNAVLARHRARLLRHADVVGVGMGRRWRGGTPSAEPVITVYVRVKRSSAQLRKSGRTALPRKLRAGPRTLGVDVVPFGKFLGRMTRPGESVGQLQPPRTRGTLGSYAIDADGRTVGITAMHLLEDRDAIEPDEPGIPVSSPSRLDDPNSAPFGVVDLGTTHGIDVARVQLAGSVTPDWVIPTIGPIRGWRWLAPDEFGIGVSMVGAASGRLDGTIVIPRADFPAFDLQGAIVVNIPTQRGDSGAALLDREGLVLGFLVGRGHAMDPASRLFTPVGPALAFLGCNIPIGGNA